MFIDFERKEIKSCINCDEKVAFVQANVSILSELELNKVSITRCTTALTSNKQK